MGLYLGDWWRGLTKLENVGRYLWVYIQPIGKAFMPVDRIPKALLLGALWGWLPCGLVYAALAVAMTQPAPGLAAGAMFAFGLGTLPAVLASGVATQQLKRLLQQRQLRFGMAIVIILFGVWTIWGGLGHGHDHQHQHMTPDHTEHGSTMDHTTMNHAAMDHSHMDHSNMNPAVVNVDENASSSTSSSSLERQRTELNQSPVEDGLHSGSSSEEAGKTLDHHH
jgi:hypothetical protein